MDGAAESYGPRIADGGLAENRGLIDLRADVCPTGAFAGLPLLLAQAIASKVRPGRRDSGECGSGTDANEGPSGITLDSIRRAAFIKVRPELF